MISENKIKHILGVARRCKEIAKEQGLSEQEQNACYVMGFLYDIGYDNLVDGEEVENHPERSYEMVSDSNKYMSEILNTIRSHGMKYDNLTIWDKILNTADLQINFYGEKVSCEDRLKDIESRHGKDTIHYQHAVKQYEAIKDFYEKNK